MPDAWTKLHSSKIVSVWLCDSIQNERKATTTIFRFKNLLQQSVCSTKDSYDDLAEAIEYIELKDASKREPAKIASLADFVNFQLKYEF